jgi:hypothetical protein
VEFEGTRKQVDPKLFINGSPWSPVGPGWGKIAVPDWSIGQMELDSQVATKRLIEVQTL